MTDQSATCTKPRRIQIERSSRSGFLANALIPWLPEKVATSPTNGPPPGFLIPLDLRAINAIFPTQKGTSWQRCDRVECISPLAGASNCVWRVEDDVPGRKKVKVAHAGWLIGGKLLGAGMKLATGSQGANAVTTNPVAHSSNCRWQTCATDAREGRTRAEHSDRH